jgi:alpha-beta hydrolase superfamily lysophospholipase
MNGDFYFASACGIQLHGYRWEPEGQPKAIVQIIHGIAEHVQRYDHFARYLSSLGYIVVAEDHMGHGKSICEEVPQGYFAGGWDGAVEDCYRLLRAVKAEFPDTPYFLFGHSMGSLVVRKYAKFYDDTIDKLIVCGSPSENPASSVALNLAKLIGKVKGDHYRSNLINNMAFSAYRKGFDEPSPNNWLSSNQDNVEAYDACEDDGYVFTTNGFQNLFTLMIDAYDPKGWNLQNKDMPILFIAGEFDPCIGSKEKWEKAQERMREIGYTNVDGVLFDGMRHEILQETNKQKVFDTVLDFLNKE